MLKRLLMPAAAAVMLCACAPKNRFSTETSTCRVELRDIAEECVEEGWLEPERSYILSPELDSKLLAVCVSEGDTVKAGTQLLRFDTREIDAGIRLTEMEIRSVELQIEILRDRRSESEIAEAEQTLEKAGLDLEEAEREAKMREELFNAGLASERELEAAKKRLAVAKTRRDIAGHARNELTSRETSPLILDMELKLERLNTELENMRRIRERHEPSAPFDGVVVMMDRRLKNAFIPEDGLRYFPDDGIALIVADIGSMRVNSVFYERDISRLKPGQQVFVTARHAPGETFTGVIASVGMQGKRHGQTAVVPVEMRVPNPGHKLMPGLTTETRVRIAEKKGVPAAPAAFVRFDGKHFVWRLDGRVKTRVPVRIGVSDGEYVEIVSGLKTGDILAME